jgi:hypothetical protein
MWQVLDAPLLDGPEPDEAAPLAGSTMAAAAKSTMIAANRMKSPLSTS